MRFTFRLVINLVLIFSLSSCQTKSGVESTSLSTSELVDAAHETYASRVRAINMGESTSSTEIPERYWAEGIRELKPIKVYTHRVNIVVVQKFRDNVEEGKYIYIPVSSYLPMDGVDGFTFQPNPVKGNKYHLGDGVFDYQRTINK
jgi:hypothetical protein